MASLVNVLEGIIQYEFGETVTLTIVDDTGVAIDISAYDGTKEVTFRHKDGVTTPVTRTLSFAVAGADGKVTFTFASSNITKAGDWTGQVKLRNSGETVITFSEPFLMRVIRNIWVST